MELARQFLQDEFVSRGMIVDYAIHEKDAGEGGNPNPHFHVMCPIRPLNPDGSWGAKQRREYILDEHGNRIPNGKGDYEFNAVPTTDWGSPERLEVWRKAWADCCNAKFEEKQLAVKVDNRSYKRQGIEQIPTIHEGPAVRQMEARGIKTDKGNLNRLIRATNQKLREISRRIKELWNLDQRKMLINTFVNSIYLFDDKALVNFNYKDGTETINFSEVECALKQCASLTGSDLEILSPPNKKASPSR